MRRIALVQLGLGRVGLALARMVRAQQQRLEETLRVRLTYVAIADSSGLAWQRHGLDDSSCDEILVAKSQGRAISETSIGKPRRTESGRTSTSSSDGRSVGVASDTDWDLVLSDAEDAFDDGLMIDVTAAENSVLVFEPALQRGWGAVLANKLPLVAPLARYRALVSVGGQRLRYEATVGAGLPVLSTLRNLIGTGDEVERIDGCLSGTLGFITYQLQQGRLFSAAVREARTLGYTEPDPRQDLGGMDVARKALILARSMGQDLELADVRVDALTPPEMEPLSLPQFMARLEDLDAAYTERVDEAMARGQVPRYVAEVGRGACRVGWRAVEKEGPMGALRGPDNIVSFLTRRYSQRPLVIIGPGAGPEVTAAGVLSDILDLATEADAFA